MGLTLSNPPGYSDLQDSVLAANQPALAPHIAKIYNNSVFGLARYEVFTGVYSNGETVPLPVSPIDGYVYKRSELIYIWTIWGSTSPSTHWVTGADSLFYCAWLVDQATGIVYSDEWYRRSGSHANVTHTNDGQLQVFTIAQRGLADIVMASSPTWSAITSGWIAIDEPLQQQLAQGLNDDAKFSVVAEEAFYLGEYYNGQTVTLPTSPLDGYHYSAGECSFIFSWRWTALGNSATLVQPALSYGQLGPFKASVNSSGVVTCIVDYIDNNANLNNYTTQGRIAVFALTKRSAVPGSLSPAASSFAEVSYDLLMPGDDLPYQVVEQILENVEQAVVTPEFFGPTTYKNGDTIPLPTSPIDSYAYARSELTYIWTWSDTTNQTGSNLRIPLFWGRVDQTSGAVTLHVWRLPPGGPFVDDNDSLCRISVIVVARRAAQATADVGTQTITPQADSGVGSSQVVDVPTLRSIGGVVPTGSINSSNQSFTLASAATVLCVIWNGQVRFDFTQASPPSTSFTTTFVPDTGDSLYAVVYT